MKVLEKGPGWSTKQRCTGKGNGLGGCESLLQVEAGDIYVTSHTDMVGDTDYFYTFTCPVCGKETDIPEKDVPASIRREAMEKKKKVLRRGNYYGYVD